jgi:hypothetical protein
MATNFHSDLPNDQIHSPKDFSVANNSSVVTKNVDGSLDWESSPFDLTTVITCGADVAGNLHNTIFYVYYTASSFIEFHIAVTGDATAFTPTAGYTQAPITIAANDTAIAIATAIQASVTVLDATASFTMGSVLNGTGKITITGMKNSKDSVDSNTGFLFLNTKTYVGEQLLHADTSGQITWKDTGKITTIPGKEYHQFSAYIVPKSASYYNKYHSSPFMGHSNKGLSNNLVVTVMPTTINSVDVPKNSILTMTSNVQSVKIHYSVWHTNPGTQSVNFVFAEAKIEDGSTAGATQVLGTIGAVTDSVPANELVVRELNCASTIVANKGLVLYATAPATGTYYITGTVELTITNI